MLHIPLTDDQAQLLIDLIVDYQDWCGDDPIADPAMALLDQVSATIRRCSADRIRHFMQLRGNGYTIDQAARRAYGTEPRRMGYRRDAWLVPRAMLGKRQQEAIDEAFNTLERLFADAKKEGAE